MNIIPPWTELEGSFVLDNTLNHDAIQTASTRTDPTRSQTGQLAHLIERAEHVLDAVGASCTSFREKLSILKERLEEERFHLAVLGQFKRGKSTLLNALLGDEVLPTSILPLTSIPTFIEYGPEFKAKVILQSGADIDLFANESPSQLADFLAEYVTEEFNPGNRRGVLEVKVEHPSPLLRRGVVLIDTPGIGSTFRHNTEATLNFLPQCDASLFVVSPDPPITEVEIDFLRQVLSKTTHTFFVLNKIDYLADDELSKAVTFIKKVLKEHAGIGEAVRIFCVSARAGLRARQSGDEAGWVKSGMQAVQEHLIDFLANQKSSALRQAISRKVLAVISDAMLQIGISLESLRMPVDQLEERMRLLKSKLDEVETQRMAQLDVLEGDRKRMIALLEEQASALRKKARSRLVEIVRQAAYEHIVPNEEEISEKLAETVPILFERELGELSRVFEKKVQEVFEQHNRRSDELVDGIRKAAAELFNVSYNKPEEHEGFEIKRRPYWVTHQWSYSLSLLPENFFDRFLPSRMRRSRAMRRLCSQIETIVMQNVENVRWPTLQNLEDTFRKFAAEIDKRYSEAESATRDAIETAYSQRKEHAEAVEADILALESAQNSLDEIRLQIESLL